jgi:acetyl esterase/lipase
MSQSILQIPPPQPGLRFPYGEDPNQFAELRLPRGAGPHPVAIFIHGGYWRAAYDLTHAGHLCLALNAAGHATWSLEYRRIGQPGAGFPGTMDDVLQGARYLRQVADRHKLDLERIVAAGHSAGGQLALWLAAQKDVQLRGVVALAAVTDLRHAFALRLGDGVTSQLLGGSPADVPERYAVASPMELLPISVPQRLLHGTVDDVIPFALSERFSMASKNAKLIPLVGAGHFELIDPRSKEWPVVRKNIAEW